MEKTYEVPKMEILFFESEDIITTSDGSDPTTPQVPTGS